jgi:hypothetical protein
MAAPARSLLLFLALLLVPARLPAQARTDPEPTKEKSERGSLLEAVGALAAGQLYQAYLNIGFIADGKAEGTYEDGEARQLLGSVLGLLDALDRQMTKVGKLDLEKADREALEEISRLSALLHRQGEELQAFWKTGDKERGARYERTRQQAWAGIRDLLHLESENRKLIELLLLGLKSKEPRVRLEAAQGLARLGAEGKEAVPALIAAFKDSSLSVRNAAGQALAKVGADAVPALIQALEDSQAAVRANAIVTLGKIGPDAREAIPALTRLLRDRNANTVRLAAAALKAVRQE